MTRSRWYLSAVLVTVSSLMAPAMAAKVKVEHDRDVDLDKYDTFQYSPSKQHTVAAEALDDQVVEALEAMLQEGGLKQVDSNPDAFVTYHFNIEQENSFDLNNLGYDLGSDWGPYGGGMGSTDDIWTQGTLIVDLWDADTEKAIWRATSAQKLKSGEGKILKQVQKALDQMLGKWNKMRSAGD